nr:PREDICTED: putative gustatory receptor 22b [Tribolium castaneum]XP_015838441.1 PREDICTED: putative gustatory receptor 22b [Tribolium castaneum]XP_015838442.1 PREDICTED: putative gustatory receptor 22b [Tribolium castaneum]|eukprot:XP_015838440.1 PREDICTED: putative gustatory receptor 22b [Tribolium castaneum]
MWAPNDLSEIITVFCNIWTYFGLPVYELETTNKSKKQFRNKTSFYFLIVLSVLLIVAVLYLVFFTARNSLYSYTLLFQYFILYGQTIGTIIYAQFKKKDLGKIFNDLLLMEEKIHRFGRKSPDYHTLGKQLMGFVLFHSFFTLLGLAFDIYLSLQSGVLQFYISVYYFALFVGYHFGFFLLAMPKIIVKLYNDFINSIKDQRTEIVVKMYADLYDLVARTVSTLQGFMLLKISSTFTVVTMDFFYSTHSLSIQQIPFDIAVVLAVSNFLLPLTILSLEFAMLYYFHTILEKKKILADFIDHNETGLYKKMDLVCLKLNLEPASFMVCGLFPLNCSLVFSMVAGITTYVIYLIQFSPKSGDLHF